MLVVDTNVLIAGIINKSEVLDTIFKLYDKGISLFSPELVLKEIKSKLSVISKYSELSEAAVLFFVSTLFSEFIKPIPKEEYDKFLDEAKKVSPHLKDAPLFALSLTLDKAPIWSREPKLKKQKFIKVLDDKDVKEFFELM